MTRRTAKRTVVSADVTHALKAGQARQDEAKHTARDGKALAAVLARAKDKARQAEALIGEIVALNQHLHTDMVPEAETNRLAQPLAIALRWLLVQNYTLMGHWPKPQQTRQEISDRLAQYLPMASPAALAQATKCEPYVWTGKWPSKLELSRMIGVRETEVDALRLKQLKPGDLTDEQLKARENRLLREAYAALPQEEKDRINAKRRAQRAATNAANEAPSLATRHIGSFKFVSEQIQSSGGRASREIVRKWHDLGPVHLAAKIAEQVGDARATEILSAFWSARKLREDGAPVKKGALCPDHLPATQALERGRASGPSPSPSDVSSETSFTMPSLASERPHIGVAAVRVVNSIRAKSEPAVEQIARLVRQSGRRG